MERVGSESSPQSWEDAYALLELVVEEAAKRKLFALDRTPEEVQASIIEMLEADDELSGIADRVKAGQPAFLDLLLSPDEQLRQEKLDELVGELIPPGSSVATIAAAVDKVLAANPELRAASGAEYDVQLMQAQEAIRRWQPGVRPQRPQRSSCLLALAELALGCGVWILGASQVLPASTVVLVVGMVLVADATYRWHMYFLSRRGLGAEEFLPAALLRFRFVLLAAVLLYSMAIGPWSFSLALRVWDVFLGTVALVVALRLLRSGRRGSSLGH